MRLKSSLGSGSTEAQNWPEMLSHEADGLVSSIADHLVSFGESFANVAGSVSRNPDVDRPYQQARKLRRRADIRAMPPTSSATFLAVRGACRSLPMDLHS